MVVRTRSQAGLDLDDGGSEKDDRDTTQKGENKGGKTGDHKENKKGVNTGKNKEYRKDSEKDSQKDGGKDGWRDGWKDGWKDDENEEAKGGTSRKRKFDDVSQDDIEGLIDQAKSLSLEGDAGKRFLRSGKERSALRPGTKRPEVGSVQKKPAAGCGEAQATTGPGREKAKSKSGIDKTKLESGKEKPILGPGCSIRVAPFTRRRRHAGFMVFRRRGKRVVTKWHMGFPQELLRHDRRVLKKHALTRRNLPCCEDYCRVCGPFNRMMDDDMEKRTPSLKEPDRPNNGIGDPTDSVHSMRKPRSADVAADKERKNTLRSAHKLESDLKGLVTMFESSCSPNGSELDKIRAQKKRKRMVVQRDGSEWLPRTLENVLEHINSKGATKLPLFVRGVVEQKLRRGSSYAARLFLDIKTIERDLISQRPMKHFERG